MTHALFVVACVLALAWVPVVLRFFRNWRDRRNPISLSICLLTGFPVYSCLFVYWVLYGVIPNILIAATMVGANFILCAAFHLAFYLSSKRFTDQRGSR